MQAELAIRAADELAALLSQSVQREAAVNKAALGLEGLEQALAAAHAANQDLHDHIRYLRIADDRVWRYLVYLKYWTLHLKPLIVYPKVPFHPNSIIR